MRIGVNGFQSQRLIQARESLGITKVALASLVGVSPATITNWEKGSQSPEEEKLRSLSQAIKFPVSWFSSSVPEHGGKPYFYRSLAATKKTAREMARVRLDWVAEISNELGNWVNWPKVNVPSISEQKVFTISDAEIEELSLECRRAWNLGLGPINDVVLTLENAGIIFARDEIGYLNMDGVSHWSKLDNRPYVFVASDKANGIRNRFDAAHELGHLVLHRNVDEETFRNKENYKEIERQADLFAGCFLLPAESFSSDVSWPTLDALLSLKSRWKVSVAAMVMRCFQLQIIDEDSKMRLFKGRSARGWVKGEPYDDLVKLEQPRLLNRAVRMLVDQKIVTKEELAYKLGLSENLLTSLCGLPDSFFSATPEASNLVELKSSYNFEGRRARSSGAGEVVNFPEKNYS